MTISVISKPVALIQYAGQHLRGSVNSIADHKENGPRLVFPKPVQNGWGCLRMGAIVEREEYRIAGIWP